MKDKLTENNPDTNRNGEMNFVWFRSIPRRISKFIAKQNGRYFNQTNRPPEAFNNILNDNNSSLQLVINISKDSDNDFENDNNSHLFSMADYLSMNEEVAMIRAVSQMSRYGWFWGPISRQMAQQRLHGTPNGSFLVRNSQINLHNFTISFRTAGKTLHYRIEFSNGYWQTFNSMHRSIVDLIDDAMQKSKENVFCYVKSSKLIPPFAVRLTNPISHFGEVSSLQNLCRLVIQKNVDVTKMDMLQLPNKLISYCKEFETIYGEMPIRI